MAAFPSLTTSGYIKLSVSSPWAEPLRVESVHTPSGRSGRNPRAQREWGPRQPPSMIPPSAPCPGALLPLPWYRCTETTAHFFKNQSDLSPHFTLCLTCLSLTHCNVCGCSQCWCGFVYDTAIFYFLIANISCFTFFPHQSRRPEITQMKRSQLCGAWDTRSLDFMTQEVLLCIMLPICLIYFFFLQ